MRGVETPESQQKRFAREAEEWNRKAKASWRRTDLPGLLFLRTIISQQKAEILTEVAHLLTCAAGKDRDLQDVEGLIQEARDHEAKAAGV